MRKFRNGDIPTLPSSKQRLPTSVRAKHSPVREKYKRFTHIHAKQMVAEAYSHTNTECASGGTKKPRTPQSQPTQTVKRNALMIPDLKEQQRALHEQQSNAATTRHR